MLTNMPYSSIIKDVINNFKINKFLCSKNQRGRKRKNEQ